MSINFSSYFHQWFLLLFISHYTAAKSVPASIFTVHQTEENFNKDVNNIENYKKQSLKQQLDKKKRAVAAERKTQTWSYKFKKFMGEVHGFLDNFFNHTIPGKLTKKIGKKVIVALVAIGVILWFMLKKQNPLEGIYAINDKIKDKISQSKDQKLQEESLQLEKIIKEADQEISLPDKIGQDLLMKKMTSILQQKKDISVEDFQKKYISNQLESLQKIFKKESIGPKDKNPFFTPLITKPIANYKEIVDGFVENNNVSIFREIIHVLILKEVLLISLDESHQRVKLLNLQYDIGSDKINGKISAKKYLGSPYGYFKETNYYPEVSTFQESTVDMKNFSSLKRHMLWKTNGVIEKQLQAYITFILKKFPKETQDLLKKIKKDNDVANGQDELILKDFLQHFLTQMARCLLVSSFKDGYS
jgi:hypothetical protein